MNNLFNKRDRDTFTIYISGREANQGIPIQKDKPLEVHTLTLSEEGKLLEDSLQSWFKERKAWAKENDPNYYVHPRYWYEPEPGECGQGYHYEVEAYYENIAERRQERLTKLRDKLPLIGFIGSIGIIVGVSVKQFFR